MVSYKELGLVNTREMFAKAIKGGYAIPAFNFNNMEQPLPRTVHPLSFRYQRVRATMQTLLFCATWLRVPLNTLKNLAGKILRSFFTSTTVTASSFANHVSTTVSRQ